MIATTPAGVYIGCATAPNTNGRALPGASYTDIKNMTLESCRVFCDSKGFQLSRAEYSSECYWNNALQVSSRCCYHATTNLRIGKNGATLNSGSAACSMPCSGKPMEICGGPSQTSLYNSTQKFATAITVTLGHGPIPGAAGIYGCVSAPSTNAPALNGQAIQPPVT